MLRLQLSHYRVVQAVRIHGTVSAAAQALGLTQPALSHQIAEAERRLGTKLFARVGRRLRLTSAGDLLATSADTILMEAGLAESTLIGKPGATTGEVYSKGNARVEGYVSIIHYMSVICPKCILHHVNTPEKGHTYRYRFGTGYHFRFGMFVKAIQQ